MTYQEYLDGRAKLRKAEAKLEKQAALILRIARQVATQLARSNGAAGPFFEYTPHGARVTWTEWDDRDEVLDEIVIPVCVLNGTSADAGNYIDGVRAEREDLAQEAIRVRQAEHLANLRRQAYLLAEEIKRYEEGQKP